MVIVSNNELEKIVPQNLEHHAHVGPVYAADLKVVQQHHRPFSERILGIVESYFRPLEKVRNIYFHLLVRLPDTLEEFDLVQSCLGVVAGALHHLQRHKLLILEVPAEPDLGVIIILFYFTFIFTVEKWPHPSFLITW